MGIRSRILSRLHRIMERLSGEYSAANSAVPNAKEQETAPAEPALAPDQVPTPVRARIVRPRGDPGASRRD